TSSPAISSRLPGSPMKCAEDKSGSTRSFSLAKAKGAAKNVPKATRPPAMRAAEIVRMGAAPCRRTKRANSGSKPRPTTLIPRVNSSIENLLKSSNGCEVAVRQEQDGLQPTSSITAAKNALNSCRRIKYPAAVVNFPPRLGKGRRGEESAVQLRG